MHELRYRIENSSPLVISAKSGDMNMVSTERHIPGTTIIGVLAKRYLTLQEDCLPAHKDKAFHGWFLEGKLAVGNARVVSAVAGKTPRTFLPAPFSIQREKYGKAVYDLLLHEGDPEIQTRAIPNYCDLDEGSIATKEVTVGLNFHHARDRARGVPKPGAIFNFESIGPGQCFEGSVRGKADDLLSLLQTCGRKWTAHLGRSRNAQYGKISFEFKEEVPVPLHMEEASGDLVTLTLVSDAIVYNACGFATTERKALESCLGGAKILKSFAKKGEVENFVGIWGLKRPSESCFRAGSAFLVDLSECDKEVLRKIQTRGLGERTHEGFGRCRIGLQNHGELLLVEEESESASRPEGKIPRQASKIIRGIVHEALRRSALFLALQDQAGFVRRPPNSLLSRLEAMSAKMAHDEFVKALKKLRRSANDKLLRCNNKNQTLFHFLEKKHITTDFLMDQPGNLNLVKLSGEIGFEPGKQPELDRRLRQDYLSAFLSTMRKNTSNGG